jgi:FkbM family methyltransferase
MTRIQTRIADIGKRLQELEPTLKHTFLEAGANDGISHSNSLQLEEMGWDGILVEPSPVAFEALQGKRACSHKFQYAIGDGSIATITGSFARGSLMGSCDPELIGRDIGKNKFKRLIKDISLKAKSIVHGETKALMAKVQVTTLTRLIEISGVNCIDIMSLDIEGYEIPALKGLEDKCNPRILAIETRKKDAFDINDLMLAKGYILVENLSRFTEANNPIWSKDHQDYLWVQQSDAIALESTFIQPSNRGN